MIHADLTHNHWYEFSLLEQLANIGCDVDRSIRWKNKGNMPYSHNAFLRAFELLYLTISDPKNKNSLRELTRIKEILLDYFMGNNEYLSTDESLHKYFFNFNYMLALQKGK